MLGGVEMLCIAYRSFRATKSSPTHPCLAANTAARRAEKLGMGFSLYANPVRPDAVP
jgi:hypothetical protein